MNVRPEIKETLKGYLMKFEEELDRVMEFWIKYSHDTEYGGFFTCLDRDGKIYDELKYCWLQGRQVWMYSKLYTSVTRFRRQDILEAAIAGGEFLIKNVKQPETRKCYFCVTRSGEPVKIQRTIFSECFYVIAMAELARATGNMKYKEEAIEMLDQIIYWLTVDDSGIGVCKLSGNPPTNNLSIPMMLMCIISEVCGSDAELKEKYSAAKDDAVRQIWLHVKRSGTVVLESVKATGEELPGSQGRLINPGHAIEAGWFLLQHAKGTGKPETSDIVETIIKTFIENPFNLGWDPKYGGIFYFLDADGFSATQLEAKMKLNWPVTEAMIAALMAYQETGNENMLKMFRQVTDYAFEHFSDPEYGEWFGYLSQQGEVTHSFKGGAYKGCFHAPRALMMCTQMLQEIIER